MSVNPILPRPQAPLIGPGPLPAREWYDFFSALLTYVGDASDLAPVIQDILARLAALEDDGFTLQGPQSVRVVGSPSDGLVQVTLRNDQATPAAASYYGTDADGTKGWFERMLSTLADVDLTSLADGNGLVWNDTTDMWEPAALMSGAGSSTDNALARWDGTTGDALQNSGVIVSDNDEISGYRGHLNTQTGTTYTLQASDSGKVVDIANGSAITLTLPNSLPVGFCCTVVQAGAGQITFTPASGATRRNRQSHTKTAGQWAMTTLYVRANSGGSAAEYVLGGDTAA